MLAGATGCHPAGVAGMRSPRGAACLTRSDASARAGEKEDSARGGLGRGEGTGAGRIVGPASTDGPEGRRRPVKEINNFSNYIFNEFSNISFQVPF